MQLHRITRSNIADDPKSLSSFVLLEPQAQMTQAHLNVANHLIGNGDAPTSLDQIEIADLHFEMAAWHLSYTPSCRQAISHFHRGLTNLPTDIYRQSKELQR
ncbi:hypothetical protein [Sphingomonas sp. SORGH_AS_0879]|nr:hypothetical protein [Sphingomonas sp. SORGH_AS_0879]